MTYSDIPLGSARPWRTADVWANNFFQGHSVSPGQTLVNVGQHLGAMMLGNIGAMTDIHMIRARSCEPRPVAFDTWQAMGGQAMGDETISVTPPHLFPVLPCLSVL